MKEVQKHNFNIVTLLSLFDTHVSPILNYCSEIWGYINAQEIEKAHAMFLKKLLCVKREIVRVMIWYIVKWEDNLLLFTENIKC